MSPFETKIKTDIPRFQHVDFGCFGLILVTFCLILARGTELPAGPAGDGCTYSRGSQTMDAAEGYLMEFLWGDYKTAVDADLPGRRARARLDGLVVANAGHRLEACRAPSGRSSGEDVARSLPGRHDLPQEGRIRTPSSEAYNVLRGSVESSKQTFLLRGCT